MISLIVPPAISSRFGREGMGKVYKNVLYYFCSDEILFKNQFFAVRGHLKSCTGEFNVLTFEGYLKISQGNYEVITDKRFCDLKYDAEDKNVLSKEIPVVSNFLAIGASFALAIANRRIDLRRIRPNCCRSY